MLALLYVNHMSLSNYNNVYNITYIWHYMNICTIIRLTLRKLASISITKLYTYLLVSLCVFTPGWFFCRCNGPGWKLPMDPRNWGLMGCLLGNTRYTGIYGDFMIFNQQTIAFIWWDNCWNITNNRTCGFVSKILGFGSPYV